MNYRRLRGKKTGSQKIKTYIDESIDPRKGGFVQKTLSILSVGLVLVGCASGHISNRMTAVPDSQATLSPPAGKALIVFLRSSSKGYDVQSSVFDLSTDPPILVGIISAKAKIAYAAEPGEGTFMVVGETAEFMSANLVASKTYYVRVAPRMGWWKARFALEPVQKGEAADDLNDDLVSSSWVVNTPASFEWAHTNMSSIEEKKYRALKSWQVETEKPTLQPYDGR